MSAQSINTSLPASNLTRRRFLQAGLCTGLATALQGQKILGANERVRIALIGCGRRGRGLIKQFTKLAGVELVAVGGIPGNP